MNHEVVVVGGGLAGIGAAWALAQAGVPRIAIVERGPELGGLAGTFERDGRFYPLAYHHVLSRDRTLLWFLERLGALPRVRWRRISMRFQHGGRLWDLRRASELLRFPLPLADKARLVRLMAKSFAKSDWSDWIGRDSAALLDEWAGPRVRETLFEPLTRLKFGLPCDQVSAAWMGARLHHREGSAPLGFVPGTNWTRVLCEGLTGLLRERGIAIRVGAEVAALEVDGDRVRAARLTDGTALASHAFVCALPTTVYRRLVPADATPRLDAIRYTAIVSMVCATRQPVEPWFYWLNLTALECSACGLFRLDALNPTIGAPGEACLNFVTHVPAHDRSFLARSDDELVRGYAADFRRLFGRELDPAWVRITRLPHYSPVFDVPFANPPVRSASWRNVWFAGNYRTFPSVASTGTALASGLDAAQAILAERGGRIGALEEISRFRLRAMPRA
jgi:protoporphyrinogen oxidase